MRGGIRFRHDVRRPPADFTARHAARIEQRLNIDTGQNSASRVCVCVCVFRNMRLHLRLSENIYIKTLAVIISLAMLMLLPFIALCSQLSLAMLTVALLMGIKTY